jgi:hypothetical protein
MQVQHRGPIKEVIMIYILMQDSGDSEFPDRMVFASENKGHVEKVHAEIVEHHKRFQVIAKRFDDDMQKIRKELPHPPSPDYRNLPPRPLVWINNAWANAYTLDYFEELQKHNLLIEEQAKRLREEYVEYYKVSSTDMNIIWSFLSDRVYYIQEVENDPDVDIRAL